MTKLINDVVDGKKAWQAFTIEHGIEKIKIQVPLENAKEFAQAFYRSINKGETDKATLFKIMNSYGGNIRHDKGVR